MKNSRGVFKKVYPQTPCPVWIFSGIEQQLYQLSPTTHIFLFGKASLDRYILYILELYELFETNG